MKRLLVLRPEPGASMTVERARLRGLDALAVPLFEVEPVEWHAPDASTFDGLLLTSANAVRHGGDKLSGLRSLAVHAVGAATTQAARDAGFEVATTGEAGLDQLLASLGAGLRLLHLCGEDRRPTGDAPQSITPVIVYRAVPRTGVDLARAQGSVALVHSPRAAERFAELIDNGGLDRSATAVAAISPAAAEAVGQGWAAVEAAESPNDEALLALAERLCNKLGRQ